MLGRAPRCDEVARSLVVRFKYSDRLDLAPMIGRWMARAGELTARGRRCVAAGATALAKIMATAAQSDGGAGRHDLGNKRRAGAAWRSQTGAGHAAAVRPVPRAGQQCAGRVPGVGRAKSRNRRQAGGADRRRFDVRATVDTCARALLRAGAAHVDVLAFARVAAPPRTTI